MTESTTPYVTVECSPLLVLRSTRVSCAPHVLVLFLDPGPPRLGMRCTVKCLHSGRGQNSIFASCLRRKVHVEVRSILKVKAMNEISSTAGWWPLQIILGVACRCFVTMAHDHLL